jgi:hypothetical protein
VMMWRRLVRRSAIFVRMGVFMRLVLHSVRVLHGARSQNGKTRNENEGDSSTHRQQQPIGRSAGVN